jgi:ABC-2 type transport system permease protein
MWAIAVKEFLQLRRDRRTVAMMLMLPFLFLVIFGYAASFDVNEVPTLVAGPEADLISPRLPHAFHVVATRPNDVRGDAVDALRRGQVMVAIVTPRQRGEAPEVLVDGTELFAARTVVTAVARAVGGAGSGGGLSATPSVAPNPASSTSVTPTAGASTSSGATLTPRLSILFNPKLRTPVIMIPGLCGVILVFVGTVATALGVVRERQTGTLEQLAVMPFRARDVFLGKIAPYLLIAAVDMVVIVGAGLLIFNVPFRGSVLTFALGAVLFLFVTLGVGVLISTVSQTQGQAIQLAIMTLLPQILLSGLFFPLYAVAAGVRWIGYVLPLTYFIKIARGVMVRGTPISALWFPMLMLAVLGGVVFTLSVLRFRRDLAPTGGKDAEPEPEAAA